MGLQYASYVVPTAPESSLADLLPQFLAGQQRGRNDAGTAAAAGIGQQPPGQPQTLADLQQQPGIPGPASSQGNPQVPPSYLASVAKSESGGDPNAVNKTTGATGLYQALPATWADVSQRHPELGLTPEGITDPGQQQKFMTAFTLDNAKQLSSAGIAPSPGTLYAAHFLGADGAVKTLSAPDNTPFASVNPQAAAANPVVANMTVGQFKQWAAQQGGGANGGYTPPAADPNGVNPATVGNRAQDLTAYQAIDPNSAPVSAVASAAPQQITAPGEPVLSMAANAPSMGAQPFAQAGAPQMAPTAAPAPQTASSGLPDRETMLALLRSQDTRPMAMQLIQGMLSANTPAGKIDMATRLANLAKAQREATMPNTLSPGQTEIDANGHPIYTAPNVNRVSYSQATAADLAANGLDGQDATKYQIGSNGKLIPIVGAIGSNGANGLAIGATGSATVDPTAPGYSTQIVTSGLTQAAIDQKALGYLTSGTPPPQGRTGVNAGQNAAIANRMAEMDPTGNLAANKSQLKSLTQSLAVQQKYLDTTQRSVANAEAGFSQVVNAFQNKGINTSQFPSVNAMVNAIKAQLSPGDIAAYQGGLTEVGNEYAQVFSRGGIVSDAVRARAASIANGSLGIPDLQKVLDELHAQGDIVIGGSQDQVKKISDQINNIVSPGSNAKASGNGATGKTYTYNAATGELE